jgi:hypothetical protein
MTTYRLVKACKDFKGDPTINGVRVTAGDPEEAALVALAALGYALEEVDRTDYQDGVEHDKAVDRGRDAELMARPIFGALWGRASW